MYAIVDIGGHQYKVEKDQRLYVNRLEGDAGEAVQLDTVLLIDNKGKINVGTPSINGAAVDAKIVEHMKGDKVIVFKKKRRKGYQKKNGHRQYLTEILIEKITESGAKPAKKATPVSKIATPPIEKVKEVKTPTAEKVKVAKSEETPKVASAKKTSKGDDLKKIEGIGPKIAELLVAAGIDTFEKLGKSSVEKIREILEEAGSRYKSHDPTTWPEQAGLAATDQWDELKKLQDELDGGKRK